MEWAQILVIMLSVLLALLLVLAIVLTVILIRITQRISAVVESAERVAANLEATTDNIARVTSPFWLAKTAVSSIKKLFTTKHNR